MQKKLVLVSGMSGAGKSTTMSILEDGGYHCIDQLPNALINDFIRLIQKESNTKYNYIALSTSVSDLAETYCQLTNSKVKFETLILDTDNEHLLLRYKFTKHRHPLIMQNKATTLEEAIEKERTILNNLPEDLNMYRIDTTFLDYSELKKKIDFYSEIKTNNASVSISFESFGYKYGIPLDADLLFDVRFLPNPYWDNSMRALSGHDEKVKNFVLGSQETKEFLAKLIPFLDYTIEQYNKEGRNHLVIGIGCTGGRHRSVTLTNYLFDHYKDQYHCYKNHRETKEN